MYANNHILPTGWPGLTKCLVGGQHTVCNDGMELTPQECCRKPLKDRLLMTFIHCSTDRCRSTATDPWEQRELTRSLYHTGTPATLMPVTLTGAIWQLRPRAWRVIVCEWVYMCACVSVRERETERVSVSANFAKPINPNLYPINMD